MNEGEQFYAIRLQETLKNCEWRETITVSALFLKTLINDYLQATNRIAELEAQLAQEIELHKKTFAALVAARDHNVVMDAKQAAIPIDTLERFFRRIDHVYREEFYGHVVIDMERKWMKPEGKYDVEFCQEDIQEIRAWLETLKL